MNQHVPIDPSAPLSEAVAAGKAAREAGRPDPTNMFAQCENVNELIHQIIGAGSVCWENPGGAGVFDDARARKVADQGLEHLAILLNRAGLR